MKTAGDCFGKSKDNQPTGRKPSGKYGASKMKTWIGEAGEDEVKEWILLEWLPVSTTICL